MPHVADEQIRMVVGPLATVTTLLMEALGSSRGSPRPWCRRVRSSLDPEDVALFGRLLGPAAPRYVPDWLVPRAVTFAPTFEEQLEHLAAASPDDLIADLAANRLLATGWSQVASAPRRWLDAYIACLRRAWAGTRPVWQVAQPLIEREAHRVGAAVVRGTFDVVLGELSPRVDVVGGQLMIREYRHRISLAPRIVLHPIVAGPRALFMTSPGSVVNDFAYPLRGVWRSGEIVDRPNRGDSLAALLGTPRADLLRRLDRPVTPGSLAKSMTYSPSTISHHLHTLEQAGLVQREPDGQRVLVHRTTRGTALLNLYDH